MVTLIARVSGNKIKCIGTKKNHFSVVENETFGRSDGKSPYSGAQKSAQEHRSAALGRSRYQADEW